MIKKSNIKYYIGILFIFFIDALHILYFNNNNKYDIYLLYEHKRYLTNILYDISCLFKFSILTYWLISLKRNIFKPLFITSLFIWFTYFLFYNQKASLLIIPVYILLTLKYNKKNEKTT